MTQSIKSYKKISLALVLALIIAACGFVLNQKSVRADSSGDGWTMSDDNVLTINSQAALSNPDACWKYAKTIIFAGDVISIPNAAFESMSALTTVDLGNVESVGRNSFSSSRKLTTVTGSSLTNVGPHAFEGCTALSSIDLSNVVEINDSAFYFCKLLKDIDISSATVIGELAFSNCISLKSVALNDYLESVETRVFYNCSLLETVELGKGTTKIGAYAFMGCESLKDIDLKRVERISEYAFYNCIKLGDIDLERLTSLEGYSFYGCESIESVNLGPGLTYIPTYAFSKCLSLKSIGLKYVTTLGSSCFSGCTSLETLDLYSIESIPTYAFLDCVKLKEIDLSNVRNLYDHAFVNCESLEKVTLGDRLTYISEYAFSECDSLTDINLGKVKTIDESAFSSCYSLENVDLGSVVTLGPNAFYSCDIKQVSLNKAKTIGEYAFFYCENLEKVYLSNTLKSLADNAFVYTSLTNIYFLGSARQFAAIDVNWVYRNYDIEYGAFDVSFDIGGTVNEDSIQVVIKNEKAVVPLEPVADGLVFTGWYIDNSYVNAYDFDTPVTADIVIYAGWMKASDVAASVFKGHTLSLEGDIGVNFYTVLPADLRSDSYMKFNVQGITNEQMIPVSSALEVTMGNTVYSVFKCKVPAKNMTSVITASLIDSGSVVDTDTYSVQQYAAYILDHQNEYSNVVGLVIDMINYGTYAQKYFNCNLDNLANSILDESDRTLKPAMYYYHPYHPEECVLPEGMTFSSVSLSLESNTVLKIFLTDTNTRNVKYYCDGVELTPEDNNGRTLIKIEGIPAHELDKDFVIKIVVEGDANEYKVTYSATNYCFYVRSGETTSVRTQELKDLMLAFLHYSESAKSYKGVDNY